MEGEPTPERAGLEGMDRVVSLPKDRLPDSNLFLFASLAPFRWPGTGSPFLIYLVLQTVNLNSVTLPVVTYVFSAFLAFSVAKEDCNCARAASSVPEAVGVLDAGLGLAATTGGLGAGLNFLVPNMPINVALGLDLFNFGSFILRDSSVLR